MRSKNAASEGLPVDWLLTFPYLSPPGRLLHPYDLLACFDGFVWDVRRLAFLIFLQILYPPVREDVLRQTPPKKTLDA